MSKKKATKKKTAKKAPKKSSSKTHESETSAKILEQNMVALQKVLSQLTLKVDRLTTKMSDLLELFEHSAKALTEKDLEEEKSQKNIKQILGKVDNLFEQNKILARGLTMMHDKVEGNIEPQMPPQQIQKPSTQQSSPTQEMNPSLQGYQQSIASSEKK